MNSMTDHLLLVSRFNIGIKGAFSSKSIQEILSLVSAYLIRLLALPVDFIILIWRRLAFSGASNNLYLSPACSQL